MVVPRYDLAPLCHGEPVEPSQRCRITRDDTFFIDPYDIVSKWKDVRETFVNVVIERDELFECFFLIVGRMLFPERCDCASSMDKGTEFIDAGSLFYPWNSLSTE